MLDKKNFMLNCDVCDTRKIKEEDYSSFEKMIINTDVMIVSEESRSVLNRLPAVINQDVTVELPENVEVTLKTINGSYEISGNTAVAEHTFLTINGPLVIHPGTEQVLERIERISINGPVKCPKSMEGYLNKISVNGPMTVYPDGCVLLGKEFELTSYFPLQARENRIYFAENKVVIPDGETNIALLKEKHVQFITKKLVVPEKLVGICGEIFDESVKFTVVPGGMALICKDVVLNETLIDKMGRQIFVDGSVTIDENFDMERMPERLIVTGKVKLRESQREAFEKADVSCPEVEILWEGRTLKNKVIVRIDNSLLDNSPKGILVKNTASVKIAEEVSPQLILDRLALQNCAKVSCNEAQESAVAAVSDNVAQIGASQDRENGIFTEIMDTKVVNAGTYVM